MESHRQQHRLGKRLQRLEVHTEDRRLLEEQLSVVWDALNSCVNGVIITDMEGRIRYINDAFLKAFEYPDKQDVLGRNAAEIFASEEIRRFSDVKAFIDATRGETEEFTVLRKNGSKFIVEVSSSNVNNPDGQIVGRMASFVDITQRKRMETEKERLIEKLQDAITNIKTLRGLIPICAHCKNVRDDKGFWHKVEVYVRDHSEAQFTHGICPKCVQELYPDLDKT
jgi:PAS domain S-box-containing protein